MPENAEAAAVYRAVQGQVVTFFNGERSVVVDLNFPAVQMILDLYEIKDKRKCFEKVVRAFHHFLRKK